MLAILVASILVGCQRPQQQGQQGVNAPRQQAQTASKSTITLFWTVPEVMTRNNVMHREYSRKQAQISLTAAQWHSLRSGSLQAIRPELNALYRRIEAQRPQDARFVQRSGRWEIQGTTGLVVDRVTTETSLKAAIRKGDREGRIHLKLVAPSRTVNWLHQQNLVHLATGESSFTGSPPFRVANIVTASRALDGLWLPSGQVFNFNAALRPAWASGAFQPGYVISGAGLATEDGGGICQVSTTVFRAALRAGFLITERHPHSHHVSYYGEPGLDAAVYAPFKNLRFKSYQAGPLFMQAEWNVERADLRIHLFGKPPRHDVVNLRTEQSRMRTAPAPQFLLDPALRPGEAVRIDMPSAGSDVKVVRELKVKGQLLRRDVFRSRYSPWGGAFSVGPGDPRLR